MTNEELLIYVEKAENAVRSLPGGIDRATRKRMEAFQDSVPPGLWQDWLKEANAVQTSTDAKLLLLNWQKRVNTYKDAE